MKNLIIIVLLIAFIAILFLLDWPTYNQNALLRGRVKMFKQALEEKKELVVKVNQLKEIYESHKDELKKVYYVLPFEKDIPNLIVQFEALASENGLILEEIEFAQIKTEAKSSKKGEGTEEKKEKDYKELGVSLGLNGTYESFKGFLEALELNVRLMDIKSIKFSFQKEETSIFSFSVDLEVYYQ